MGYKLQIQSQNVYTNVDAENYFNNIAGNDASNDALADDEPPKSKTKTTNKPAVVAPNSDDYYLNKSLRYVPLEVIANLDTSSSGGGGGVTAAKEQTKNSSTTTGSEMSGSGAATNDAVKVAANELIVPSMSNATTTTTGIVKRHSRVSLATNSRDRKRNESPQAGNSLYTNLDKVRTEALKNTLEQVNKPQHQL